MTNLNELTADSAALLAELLADGAGNGFYENSGATFMLMGELTKAQRGNMTDLKVKGLIETAEEDERGYWVIFSEAALLSTKSGRQWLRDYSQTEHSYLPWLSSARRMAGFTGAAPAPEGGAGAPANTEPATFTERMTHGLDALAEAVAESRDAATLKSLIKRLRAIEEQTNTLRREAQHRARYYGAE